MIDKNDAPDGYVAIDATFGCNGCAFYTNNNQSCQEPTGCFAAQRNDGHSVIRNQLVVLLLNEMMGQESKSMAVINTSKYWMVHGNGPTEVKHTTNESAITEAKLLSMQHPGQVFTVLEAIECYHTSVPEPKRYEMK